MQKKGLRAKRKDKKVKMESVSKLKCSLNGGCSICCRECSKYDKCKDNKKCFNVPEKCGVGITAEMQEKLRAKGWERWDLRK